MDALGVFGIIFIILIVFGILLILILAGLGFFESKNVEDIIKNPFSIERGVTSPRSYMTANTSNDIIFSNSSSISCSKYTWTYGTFTSGTGTTAVSIPNALIYGGDPTMILAASASTVGSKVTLIKPTAMTDKTLTSWNFNEVDRTWCLSSTSGLCLFDNQGTVELDRLSANTGFIFTPVKAITSSTVCS